MKSAGYNGACMVFIIRPVCFLRLSESNEDFLDFLEFVGTSEEHLFFTCCRIIQNEGKGKHVTYFLAA